MKTETIAVKKTSISTIIKFCSCKHAYQDQLYGKEHRVHNAFMKNREVGGYRCTVCGAVKGK